MAEQRVSYRYRNGEVVEIIVRDSVTVEDVYDHLIHGVAYRLLGGSKGDVNIGDMPSKFIEELRWPSM